MCDYCKNLFNGESNDLLTNLKVEIKGFELFSVFTRITDVTNEVTLETELSNMDGRSLVTVRKQIQYCPMCGRKLV